MKIVYENKLLEAINNVGEFEDKIHGEAPEAFADAVKDSRKKEKEIRDILDKHREETTKDLDNTDKDRIEGNVIKRSPGSKKLHLEESLFEESYLNDGDLNQLFFKILPRSKKYEMNTEGDLIITDYNLGDRVGIHLDMLQDYDLDYDVFFDPDEDDDTELEENLNEKDTGDIYLVKKKRNPLADIIQERLTTGEWGYIKHPSGEVNPTLLGGANYLPSQIGMEYDENDNTFITVHASSKDELDKAKEIADKFGREYGMLDQSKMPNIKKGHEFELYIELKDEDWDKPYYNPEDPVYEKQHIKESKAEESKFAKKYPDRFEKIKEIYIKNKWPMIDGDALDEVAEILNVNIKDELTEDSEIRVKVYNFRPSTELGKETYKKIAEAGKLGNLQDMVDEMYPDDVDITSDEMNELLSEKSEWLLNMLDIHEENIED